MNDTREQAVYTPFRWFILLCFLVSNIAVMSALIGPASIVFRIASDLGIDVGKATLLVMAWANFVLILGNIAGGFLIDRVGLTKAWIIGSTLALLSAMLWPVLGHSIAGVIFIRTITGLSVATVSASVASLGASWFKMSERSIVIGAASSSAAVGVSAGLIAVPAFLEMTGTWQWAMASLASFAVLGLAMNAIAFFGPKPPIDHDSKRSGAKDRTDFKGVFKLPATLAMCGVGFCGGWAAQAFNVMMPNYLAMPAPVGQGLGALKAGAFISLVPYGQAAGGLMAGLVFDKVFRGNAGAAMTVTMITTGILCYSVTTTTVIASAPLLSVLLVMTGMSIGTTPPMLFAFLARTYPAGVMGRLGGIFQAVVAIGGTAGLTAGGAMLSLTGTYTASITLLLAVLSIGALVAAVVLGRRAENSSLPASYR